MPKKKSIIIDQLFDRLKDILRQSDDHITGRDAVIDISQLITLKKLEDTNRIEYFGLPDYCKFSSIVKAIDLYQKNSDQNLTPILIYGDIKTNVLNKGIFSELINNSHTNQAFTSDPHYKKLNTHIALVREIDNFGLINDDSNSDLLGSSYEVLLRTQLVGRDDGQYFTNRNVVKLIVNEIQPIIGETIYDPASGTGGFLIWSYLHLKSQIKSSYDQKFLSENTLFGCDIDKNVMQLLHCNLLLNDIKHNEHFKCCNTITQNCLYDKYDIILSNFPFGKKGCDIFKIIDDSLFNYYGFKTKILPILFLKHTINILKPYGRAGVIVTIGELSNVHWEYYIIRKKLVEENNLTKIVMLPKGLFENAPNVSTAILFFSKKAKTDKVQFVKIMDVTCNKQILMKTVTYQEIVNAKYILNPDTYCSINSIEYNNIPLIPLSDLCEIKYGSIIAKNVLQSKGKFNVYGGGNAGYVHKHNHKVFITNHAMTIHTISEKLSENYLFYIMKLFQRKLYLLQKGTIQPGIKRDDINQIKIPVPSIEIQNYIVDFLDQKYSKNKDSLQELSKYFNKINFVNILLNCQFVKFI
jgi:type I restriction-modification system DNA methylase subunit